MKKKYKQLDKINFDRYIFHPEYGIWSKFWKKWLKGRKAKINNSDDDFYLVVELMNKDGSKNFYQYHRVIAYIFVKKPDKYKDIPFEELEVNHINEIKYDNRASNLEWCDRQYNVNFGDGNKKRSDTLKKVVHTSEWNEKVADSLSKEVVQIKDNGENAFWKSIAECSRNGYNQSSVSQCCNNKFHPKCKNHRRYKSSEWYFKDDYNKLTCRNT